MRELLSASIVTCRFVNASSFQKCELPEDDEAAQSPIEYTARRLQERGFSRYGQEVMINGVTGEELRCEIFIGLVYYQRLRHMVKDKWQVRAVGKNNRITRQPIKGKKAGGGIRIGEMERDSLLAHGAAYLLHDRLHLCSDYHVLDVCKTCGSIVSLLHKPSPSDRIFSGLGSVMVGHQAVKTATCLACPDGGNPVRVSVPYVLKFLVAELAVMAIKVTLDVTQEHM
jgi:DNA-directed RNA polymerase I subunit RPA2